MFNVALMVQAGIRRHQAEQQLQARGIQRDEGQAAERIQSSWLQRQRRQQVVSERTRPKLRWPFESCMTDVYLHIYRAGMRPKLRWAILIMHD